MTKAPAGETDLHSIARSGDLNALYNSLQKGANPDVRDAHGRTPLFDAVAAGQVEAARALISSGANVNAWTGEGRTPLIEAAEKGRMEAARLLVESHADLNANARGAGSALDAADRAGHIELAAMLRQAGARSATGRSVGDTVCVRPWGGDGYCGTVESVSRNDYTINVAKIVGCERGCAVKEDCSATRKVGGPDGVKVGDIVRTVSWCLTHTGVQP